MVRLRRIPAMRAANMLALTFGIPYLILALIGVFVFSPWSVTTSGSSGSTSTTVIGPATLISVLVAWFFAMLSIWIFVALACALYNVIAGRFGGIELEFTTIPPANQD